MFDCVTDQEKLTDCLKSILYEQQQLSAQAVATTLSTVRLQQQLTVLERYFRALTHHQPTEVRSPIRKKQNLQANLSKQKRLVNESI